MGMKGDTELWSSNPAKSAETQGQLAQFPQCRTALSPRGTDNVLGQQEPVSAVTFSPPASASYHNIPSASGDGRTRTAFDQNPPVTHEGSPATVSIVCPDGQTSGSYALKTSLPYSSCIQQQSCVQSTDSEPQASPSDYTGDPWRITEEQREYYFNQFKSLQPDMKSLISGSVAKDLFTKSKLPVRELCHIWELSDVDCDGALTLYEFCAAFHLVVARKNGYSLPATLPETLLPEYLQRNEATPQIVHEDEPFGSQGNVTTESLPAPQQWRDWNRIEENIVAEPLPVHSPASTLQKGETHLLNNKQGCQGFDHCQKRKTRPRSHSSNSADDAIKKGEEPPAPPPRVQKTHSRASSLDLNKLFQQSNQAQKSGALLPPPALPPRPPTAKIPPFCTKTKSSKVPAEEQEPVQQANFADFSKFSDQAKKDSTDEFHPQMSRDSNLEEENQSPVKDMLPRQPPLKPLRRKLQPESQVENQEQSSRVSATAPAPETKPQHQLQKMSSNQRRAIQTAVRKNKEANMVLVRLNGELQQQFKDIRKERIVLESQLEQLRPIPHT
uniref:RalBP1-associated Eps domain-containing protein 2 n=1 Tax=Callorhinchus milii TaxID=7868 RepID=A0A4W3I376_CALMI